MYSRPFGSWSRLHIAVVEESGAARSQVSQRTRLKALSYLEVTKIVATRDHPIQHIEHITSRA
ncbi:MAG: hypothetical protein KDA96_19420 [Planctomycetaceae bacterium]|nr:hypothetical protein [Planctomycetaceae bacterium]